MPSRQKAYARLEYLRQNCETTANRQSPTGDPDWKIDGETMLIPNLSFWHSPAALQAFVYQGPQRTNPPPRMV